MQVTLNTIIANNLQSQPIAIVTQYETLPFVNLTNFSFDNSTGYYYGIDNGTDFGIIVEYDGNWNFQVAYCSLTV